MPSPNFLLLFIILLRDYYYSIFVSYIVISIHMKRHEVIMQVEPVTPQHVSQQN